MKFCQQLGFILLTSCICFGCDRTRASRVDCETIFERLIALELGEMGYQDPELIQRWMKRLRVRYRAELDECVGRTLPSTALLCIQEATTVEIVSHECLR